MGSTYLSLHFHIVFATKHRAPSIAPSWRDRLHQYLGATAKGLGGNAEAVGGIEDHVHLLVGLKATHVLADVVREVKKSASAWVHQEVGIAAFAWQEGYAAFTVSATIRSSVRDYIAHQEEHHRKQTSKDELIDMLHRAGIEYDERYLE